MFLLLLAEFLGKTAVGTNSNTFETMFGKKVVFVLDLTSLCFIEHVPEVIGTCLMFLVVLMDP